MTVKTFREFKGSRTDGREVQFDYHCYRGTMKKVPHHKAFDYVVISPDWSKIENQIKEEIKIGKRQKNFMEIGKPTNV